jgi:uncharacterized protein YbbC (DUF1343 family)
MAQSISSKISTGADALAGGDIGLLQGKRLGVLTNHTGLVRDERLIDVLARIPGIKLAAILTPEHGLSGGVEAGAKVGHGYDAATGIPVISLYDASQKPTPAMLSGIDVLIFDMQDIGVRYYTYISTMGLAMQAAAAAGLPFVVLDRPNPLGGEDVSGFVLDARNRSFVGLYAIPQVHGMTVGELARMIKGERLLAGLERLDLKIVRLKGWRRDMRWPDTGLAWVATSPNIPTFDTALAYAGTGLLEATAASEGRGTTAPFLMVGHPSADPVRVAERLQGAGLPGVTFTPTRFVPQPMPGIASRPRFAGREVAGVRLTITDARTYRPAETGIHVLAALDAEVRRSGSVGLVEKADAFGRLAGTDRLLQLLDADATPEAIIAAWQSDAEGFRRRRAPYLLY